MGADHPVQLDTVDPPQFDRVQLAIRIAIAIVLGWFGITLGWLMSLLYLVLPLIAAGAISSGGREGYTRDHGPQLWRVLSWILRCEAYLMLLVDRLPTADEAGVTITIRYTGEPTIGSALARLLTSFPSALVLGVLSIVSAFVWIPAALFVLLGAAMPRSILAFQRGVLSWQARLLAYHVSLVVEYPPWTLHTDHHLEEKIAC
jgi:hypothetical protein